MLHAQSRIDQCLGFLPVGEMGGGFVGEDDVVGGIELEGGFVGVDGGGVGFGAEVVVSGLF